MTRLLESILRYLAQAYLRRSTPSTIIVVTGSIGKTSTTKAIAHVLRESGRSVRATRHNYNNNLGVPASVLGKDLPKNAKNPLEWMYLFASSILEILKSKKNDYVVLELGTDNPGDIRQFSWLKPDVAVVTAVAPEHMEFFKTLENVAAEELSVGSFSEKVLVNRKTVDDTYLHYAKNDELYHYDSKILTEQGINRDTLQVIGEHSLDALAAALWIAKQENIPKKTYQKALTSFQSPPGRMRKFDGKYGATIIDDTYNSSPEAAIAALQHLYSETVNHRIALLGNMNELGEAGPELHEKVGAYCNKTKLDLVVTLGNDANTYTAASAEKNGCNVSRTESPEEAATVILDRLKTISKNDTTLVLCKGSQNGVFAEETVKLLLHDAKDANQLVRQSKRWKEKKGNYWTGKAL